MEASFDALADDDLPGVAERLLSEYPPDPVVRNKIQEILWAHTSAPSIPKRNRRELARELSIEDLYLDTDQFSDLLGRLWVLDDDPFASFGSDHSLRAAIDRHVYRNPGDWSVEELWDKLGVFNASDKRFALFLEGLASSDVLPDEAAQRRFANIVNGALRECGIEMLETDTEGGYPVFTLISTHLAPTSRPKNLIFGSPGKPDLRLRDAVSNDVEIVTNADKVLVYDRPIGSSGLRWRDLQDWWADLKGITGDDEAKRTLYARLRESLPESSPPQRLLFDAFYRGFGSEVPGLPALLPEVWLHWDPKTVKERGFQALLRFRMDFLLLLPGGVRVVVEVDGKHHYARRDGWADSARYAAMVAGDRDLSLAGYHVFRFGAHELEGEEGKEATGQFFRALFRRFGVSCRAVSGQEEVKER